MSKIFRWATRKPTGREKWQLVELPLDDLECAKRGWNLIGPALDVSSLTETQQDRLLWLAKKIPPRSQFSRLSKHALEQIKQWEIELQAFLSRLPRATVPGYDVDGDDAETAIEIMLLLLEVEEKRGNKLRIAWSSGPQSAGLHAEFGPALEEARDPDLLRIMLRRAGVIAREAGLVPQPGTNTGVCGTPLFWVLPKHAQGDWDRPKDVPARLDLSPLNHSPGSRGRLFRPLGGHNKRGDGRKTLIPEFANIDPTHICAQHLCEAPALAQGERKREDDPHVKEIRKRAQRARERAAASPMRRHARARLEPLIRVLKRLRKPGQHHDERLAFAGLARTKHILTRQDWIDAIGEAWGDREDMAAAWDTTEGRIRAEQPVRGGPWLRRRLGTRAWVDLAFVIAKITRRSLAQTLRRMGGLPRISPGDVKWAHDFDPELTDAETKQVYRRLRVAGSCSLYMVKHVCEACGKLECECHAHCDHRDACGICCLRHIEAIDRHMENAIKGVEKVMVVEDQPDDTRKKERAFTGMIHSHLDVGFLRVTVPTEDGRWRTIGFADVSKHGHRDLATIRGFGAVRYETMSGREALLELEYALMQRFVRVHELLERGDKEAIVEYLKEIYRTQSVTGRARASFPFPSSADLIRERQELAETLREMKLENDKDGEYCTGDGCPADAATIVSVVHIPSGFEVIRGARYQFPPPLEEIRNTHHTMREYPPPNYEGVDVPPVDVFDGHTVPLRT